MDEGEFIAAVLRNPVNCEILERMPALGLSDVWLVSGALFQSAWNTLSVRAPDYGVKDYDVFYYDPDTSWNAEDIAIKRAAAVFGDLAASIEIRNQARVHLWFETKFGEAYAPLGSAAQALERFVSPLFAVGVRLESDGRLRVEAPFGLADLFALRLRRNPRRRIRGFERIAADIVRRWPELSVE